VGCGWMVLPMSTASAAISLPMGVRPTACSTRS
jgi:hypothetical protein